MLQNPGLTRRGLLMLAGGAGVQSRLRLYAASSDFWNKKEPAEWSSEEIDRLVTKSPWARQVNASSAAMSRQSGGSGGGSGNGGGMGDPGIGGGGGGYPGGGGMGYPGGGMGGGRGGGGGGRRGKDQDVELRARGAVGDIDLERREQALVPEGQPARDAHLAGVVDAPAGEDQLLSRGQPRPRHAGPVEPVVVLQPLVEAHVLADGSVRQPAGSRPVKLYGSGHGCGNPAAWRGLAPVEPGELPGRGDAAPRRAPRNGIAAVHGNAANPCSRPKARHCADERTLPEQVGFRSEVAAAQTPSSSARAIGQPSCTP